MNDEIKRLLELAAKAAGIDLSRADYREHWGFEGARKDGTYIGRWNPGNDDGDSRRLEVAIGADVTWYPQDVWVSAASNRSLGEASEYYVAHGGDRAAALRMALLRAAAAIGEVMP